MKITIIAGARPNFMKIAPIIEAIEQKKKDGKNISYRLVHTGQHYDKNLSGTFFEELGIPLPDKNFDVKSGSQAEQTAAIMIAFEKDLMENPTDLVLVVGDVTSTMACAIVAKKEGVKLAHVEAGIRSGDLRMPEEINRIVTDSLTDYFFTTTIIANENLFNLGVKKEQVFFVGNVMIDTLKKHQRNFKKPKIWDGIGLENKKFFVLTMHRPSNVDEKNDLKIIIEKISEFSRGLPIVFPVHPRTKKLLQELDLNSENLHFVEPLGYLEFNYLVKNAFTVITDSGGITEETTVMNVPCITLRENTERPETCVLGTNVLVGKDIDKLKFYIEELFKGSWKTSKEIDLWDGKAAVRIIDEILQIYKVE
ncbi:UDP-N-acetylglucosamine 2-epimerase (non-hydrolysing) [Flavobacteriaceae bacterium MAR_2010_188]|nr:UDP-N-acetylglucosamine 2-epimerase (non-hydrolysing) [Flavobacteriaceae bacterium MAR_2010_188]